MARPLFADGFGSDLSSTAVLSRAPRAAAAPTQPPPPAAVIEDVADDDDDCESTQDTHTPHTQRTPSWAWPRSAASSGVSSAKRRAAASQMAASQLLQQPPRRTLRGGTQPLPPTPASPLLRPLVLAEAEKGVGEAEGDVEMQQEGEKDDAAEEHNNDSVSDVADDKEDEVEAHQLNQAEDEIAANTEDDSAQPPSTPPPTDAATADIAAAGATAVTTTATTPSHRSHKPAPAYTQSSVGFLQQLNVASTPPSTHKHRSHLAHALDSAQKRIHFVRGGLAEQCKKLQAYEQSEFNFWFHRQAQGLAVEERQLCLLVLDAWEANNGLLTTCRVLSGHQQAELNVHFRAETVNRLPRLKAWVLGAEEFFQIQQMPLLPRPGTCVQIDAPWQELRLPGRERPVILGTLYCQVRAPPDSQEQEAAAGILALDAAEGRDSQLQAGEREAAPGNGGGGEAAEGGASAAAATAENPNASGRLRTVASKRQSPHKLPPVSVVQERRDNLASGGPVAFSL